VVRSAWEPRDGNATANTRVPTTAELDRFNRHRPRYDACAGAAHGQSDRDFRGTTDEIIRWAAWKWGFDEDLVRAVAVKESFWKQAAAGDWDGRQHQSFGLMQVRRNPEGERGPDWNGTFPTLQGLDGVQCRLLGRLGPPVLRRLLHLAQRSRRGEPYAAGDLWGQRGRLVRRSLAHAGRHRLHR
jgi:hypothetical protein